MATVRLNRLSIRLETVELAQRFLNQVMYEVEFAAKLRAQLGIYATGHLSESIHSIGPTVVGSEVTGSIGTPVNYAASVHDGAKVHPIFPKGAAHIYRFGPGAGRPKLKFYWRRAGRVVYLPQVPGSPGTIGRSHPGQKGKGFLIEPLRDAAIRHGMRFLSRDIQV